MSCWRSTARRLLTAASDQLLDYSERFMRAEIAEMPDGVYYAQDLHGGRRHHRAIRTGCACG